MPVTVRLSRKFYERFGEDVAAELVEWFNSVDAAYRSEFRDLFEAHFGRLEAKLEQMATKVELAELRGELNAKIEAQGARLITWSFGFWVANVVTVLTILKLARVL